MVHFAKFLQFAGLLIIPVGFFARFPELMSPKLLLGGMALFGAGWWLERRKA